MSAATGPLFVVLDTNTFLHYVSLEQIEWKDVFPGRDIVLFICPPLIRELNKHKDTPRTSKLRDRASAALRSIEEWADSDVPVRLRENAEVRLRARDASIEFGAYNLVRDIADDHFIATLIELQRENQSESVVLLTKDIGLKLKAKSHGFGVASLPESTLLPEDVLPSEAKIKQLEAQVRELQNVRPKLSLAFPDGSNRQRLSFQRLKGLSESQVAGRKAKIREEHPHMVERAKPPETGTSPIELYSAIFSGASALSHIDPKLIAQYNTDLETYFQKYDQYLEELVTFYEWESRTAAINLVLLNEGSCPAEDIDIFMHFPDGFQLFDEDHYKKKPKAPKPPEKPTSFMEQAAAGLSLGSSSINFGSYSAALSSYRPDLLPEFSTS